MSRNAESTYEPLTSRDQERLTEALDVVATHRSAIDQTKGMLMLVYGVGPDHAFDLLRNLSQDHNLKLRLVAEQIGEDLIELAHDSAAARRSFADFQQAAHERISRAAARQRDGDSPPMRH